MKAYGIPVQSFTWKPASNATSLFDSAAATIKSDISEPTLASVNSSSSAAHAHPKASATPDHLHEACHLSTKQLEDLMDDDCSGEALVRPMTLRTALIVVALRVCRPLADCFARVAVVGGRACAVLRCFTWPCPHMPPGPPPQVPTVCLTQLSLRVTLSWQKVFFTHYASPELWKLYFTNLLSCSTARLFWRISGLFKIATTNYSAQNFLVCSAEYLDLYSKVCSAYKSVIVASCHCRLSIAGPVSNGDPMLSSPHLSPHGVGGGGGGMSSSSPSASSSYGPLDSPGAPSSMDLSAA